MSYTPTTWTTGDTITATALNKMEQGIADSGAGGYDAVISIYHDENSSHDFELDIISGSYSTLKAKTMNNEPPPILAYVWDELSHYTGATTMTSIYICPTEVSPNNDLMFTVKMPSSNPSTHTSWFGLSIGWDSSDELYIY